MFGFEVLGGERGERERKKGVGGLRRVFSFFPPGLRAKRPGGMQPLFPSLLKLELSPRLPLLRGSRILRRYHRHRPRRTKQRKEKEEKRRRRRSDLCDERHGKSEARSSSSEGRGRPRRASSRAFEERGAPPRRRGRGRYCCLRRAGGRQRGASCDRRKTKRYGRGRRTSKK